MAKGWYITSELGYKKTLQPPFSVFFVFLPPTSLPLSLLLEKAGAMCLAKESRSLPATKQVSLRVDPPALVKLQMTQPCPTS